MLHADPNPKFARCVVREIQKYTNNAIRHSAFSIATTRWRLGGSDSVF
jgi:hypothetical protein